MGSKIKYYNETKPLDTGGALKNFFQIVLIFQSKLH